MRTSFLLSTTAFALTIPSLALAQRATPVSTYQPRMLSAEGPARRIVRGHKRAHFATSSHGNCFAPKAAVKIRTIFPSGLVQGIGEDD
jgi:hypothetical protein